MERMYDTRPLGLGKLFCAKYDDRIYHVSRFAVTQYRSYVHADLDKSFSLELNRDRAGMHAAKTDLFTPRSLSISTELYSARPFPMATSSHASCSSSSSCRNAIVDSEGPSVPLPWFISAMTCLTSVAGL
jgi:hypothetical protein